MFTLKDTTSFPRGYTAKYRVKTFRRLRSLIDYSQDSIDENLSSNMNEYIHNMIKC